MLAGLLAAIQKLYQGAAAVDNQTLGLLARSEQVGVRLQHNPAAVQDSEGGVRYIPQLDEG